MRQPSFGASPTPQTVTYQPPTSASCSTLMTSSGTLRCSVSVKFPSLVKIVRTYRIPGPFISEPLSGRSIRLAGPPPDFPSGERACELGGGLPPFGLGNRQAQLGDEVSEPGVTSAIDRCSPRESRLPARALPAVQRAHRRGLEGVDGGLAGRDGDDVIHVRPPTARQEWGNRTEDGVLSRRGSIGNAVPPRRHVRGLATTRCEGPTCRSPSPEPVGAMPG